MKTGIWRYSKKPPCSVTCSRTK